MCVWPWALQWRNTSVKWSHFHDDVIKWIHFPRYWPFVRGIHRSPVKSPHKGQWRGTLMFFFICARINCWVNNDEAGDLRRHRTHYDVIVTYRQFNCLFKCLITPITKTPSKFCVTGPLCKSTGDRWFARANWPVMWKVLPRYDDLQYCLNQLYSYCEKWGLVVNTNKTKMVMSKHTFTNENFNFGKMPLQCVRWFNYLGFWYWAQLSRERQHREGTYCF